MWCAVVYWIEKKEVKEFVYGTPNYLKDFADYIRDADLLVGHNIISFDNGVINTFTGIHFPTNKLADTLVRSRLFNSARDGGHSLERWGAYFKVPKVGKDYDDWEHFNPIIVKRCRRDVQITAMLWDHLKREGKNVSEMSIKIEEEFQALCSQITARGFPINIPLLEEKYSHISARKQDLDTQIAKAFPAKAYKIAEVEPKKTKAGEFAKNTKGFAVLGKRASLVQGPFTLIEWKTFNIRSNPMVRDLMDSYGWKPYVKTKSGKNWKVCEENLDTLPNTAPKEAWLIPQWLKVDTRLNLMEDWFANLNRDTQRIHGSIIGIGAVTHRCAHNSPNTANIPGNDDEEWNIRECWGFNPELKGDRRLIGVDAKGIQMRVLAHLLAAYTDDKSFVDACLHGDIHVDFTLPILRDAVPQAPNLSEDLDTHWIKQNVTKRFNYAYVLGMGNEKAGILLGTDAKLGKLAKERFTNAFPGMSSLNNYLHRCALNGWAQGPDGRFFPITSEFKALSVFLQGYEAIIMKVAGLLFWKESRRRNLDAWLCAFVHDEYQLDCHIDIVDEAGQLMADCIKRAGEILNLRVPMDADYDVGYTWTETH